MSGVGPGSGGGVCFTLVHVTVLFKLIIIWVGRYSQSYLGGPGACCPGKTYIQFCMASAFWIMFHSIFTFTRASKQGMHEWERQCYLLAAW